MVDDLKLDDACSFQTSTSTRLVLTHSLFTNEGVIRRVTSLSCMADSLHTAAMEHYSTPSVISSTSTDDKSINPLYYWRQPLPEIVDEGLMKMLNQTYSSDDLSMLMFGKSRRHQASNHQPWTRNKRKTE